MLTPKQKLALQELAIRSVSLEEAKQQYATAESHLAAARITARNSGIEIGDLPVITQTITGRLVILGWIDDMLCAVPAAPLYADKF